MRIGITIFCAALFFVGVSGVSPEAAQKPAVNPDARIVEDFEARVEQYVKLERQAEAGLPPLKPTDSPARIRAHERLLARAIRRMRGRAKQGDIFTPEIASEFRRLVRIAFEGTDARRIRGSLEHGAPVEIALHPNESYPEGVPLQTMPPSLLLNLPKLPPELEYRIARGDLILRDVKANLVVDLMPRVFSST